MSWRFLPPFLPRTREAANSAPAERSSDRSRSAVPMRSAVPRWSAPFLLMVGLGSSGCLVTGPPDLTQPQPARANLNLFAASPSVTKVLVAETGQKIQVNIPFNAIDAGQTYQAQLWIDWGFSSEDWVAEIPIVPQNEAPTPEDELEREIVIEWTVGEARPVSSGCHTLTLQFTPAENIVQGYPRYPIDPDLVAVAQWWLNVDVPVEGQQTLENCPSDASAVTE